MNGLCEWSLIEQILTGCRLPVCRTLSQTLRATSVGPTVCEQDAALKHLGYPCRNLDFCDLTVVWREGGLGDKKTTSDLTQGMVVGLERTGQIKSD